MHEEKRGCWPVVLVLILMWWGLYELIVWLI